MFEYCALNITFCFRLKLNLRILINEIKVSNFKKLNIENFFNMNIDKSKLKLKYLSDYLELFTLILTGYLKELGFVALRLLK